MAQINLLKQSSVVDNSWELIPKLLARLFSVVLIVLVVYYVWLYFRYNSIVKKIVNTKTQIELTRAASMQVAGRNELLVRQQQIAALKDLLDGHIYWSQIMPKIAGVTLKKATYSNLKVSDDGILRLVVNVPDLENLDKYLQVFNLPEVNKNFSGVNISGYHKVQSKDANSVSFEVSMKFNSAMIQYSGLSSAQ